MKYLTYHRCPRYLQSCISSQENINFLHKITFMHDCLVCLPKWFVHKHANSTSRCTHIFADTFFMLLRDIYATYAKFFQNVYCMFCA